MLDRDDECTDWQFSAAFLVCIRTRETGGEVKSSEEKALDQEGCICHRLRHFRAMFYSIQMYYTIW